MAKHKNTRGERVASPIKDSDDIKMIYRRLVKRCRHREAELFRIGCNLALRISDLLSLKFTDFYREDNSMVDRITIVEIKTGKRKTFTINNTVKESVRLLRSNHPDYVYLFQAHSRNIGERVGPVSRQWVNRVLKQISEDVGLDYNLSTHSMRKTFGYHAYKAGADINELQKMFNHARVIETFIYIGITEERIQNLYTDYEIAM